MESSPSKWLAFVLLVPITLAGLASCSGSGTSRPAAGTSSDASSASVATPSPADSSTADVSALPVGLPPQLALYADGMIDGVAVDLPAQAVVLDVARHGDGWVIAYETNAKASNSATAKGWLAFVDGDGTITATQRVRPAGARAAGSLATSRDGSVAYVNAAGRLQLDDPSGNRVRTWSLSGRTYSGLRAITADQSVVTNEGFADFVVATPSGDFTSIRIVNSKTLSSPGLVFPDSDPGAEAFCYGITQPTDGKLFWISCVWPWLGLNPSATVLARAETTGSSARIMMTDTATGQTIVDATLLGAKDIAWKNARLDYAWENDTQLLLGVYSDSNGWQIIRVTTNGTVTRAETPDLGRDQSPPYGFALDTGGGR